MKSYINLGSKRLATDVAAVVAVGVFCVIVGSSLKPWLSTTSFPILWSQLLQSVFWMGLGTIVPLLIRHTDFAKKNDAAMPILTVLWRFSVVATALLASAATKWPLDKSFAACLLGCYFPFIILESVLSVRHVSQDSRQR